MARKFLHFRRQLVIVEPFVRSFPRRRGRVAAGDYDHRTRALSTELCEEREAVLLADAKRSRHDRADPSFRQQSFEEGARLRRRKRVPTERARKRTGGASQG